MIRFGKSREKALLVLLHLLVWGVFFILPVLLFYMESGYDRHFLEGSYLRIILYAIIFYLNYFIYQLCLDF